MAYFNTTIKDLISERIGRNTFLPAIQREYVWNPNQVEKLFDSIMCGYPISSFLFWKIREEKKKDWTSYEFIKDFDQATPHNKEANLDGVNQDIYLVLDGQQRITSINIALRGTYRFFYRKWRTTRLYLNLLWDKGDDNPEEMTYQFLFKENNQILPRTDYPQLWYRVGDILNYDDAEDAKDSIENDLNGFDEDTKKRARKMISKLFSVVNVTQNINYYEEKSDDYDKVLEIFIRTNTGGQKLEYSDILLSTATAKWRNLNAREEINKFTDEINKIGTLITDVGDFQNQNQVYLFNDNKPIKGHKIIIPILKTNLIASCTYFSVRHCINATWKNDRKQFEIPKDGWQEDKDFQTNCLAYTLFHGQNRISASQYLSNEEKTPAETLYNHWIPFREEEVGAPTLFASHFMTDFMAGKLGQKEAPTQEHNLFTLAGEENPKQEYSSFVPKEPLQFTPQAQAVFEAGKALWQYYFSQPKVNVNASLYDIREYFQGRNEKGKMNNKSTDERYNTLIGNLREALGVLAQEIEVQVYAYGFLL